MCAQNITDCLGEVTSVQFDREGKYLLAGCKDNSNRLFDLRMVCPSPLLLPSPSFNLTSLSCLSLSHPRGGELELMRVATKHISIYGPSEYFEKPDPSFIRLERSARHFRIGGWAGLHLVQRGSTPDPDLQHVQHLKYLKRPNHPVTINTKIEEFRAGPGRGRVRSVSLFTCLLPPEGPSSDPTGQQSG